MQEVVNTDFKRTDFFCMFYISGIVQLTPSSNPTRCHSDSTGTACFTFWYR